ncbi:MAG: hypothetical protein A2X86_07160 [Bdellovibrionales bacterium GWA2_49_15]|nr:MAG: hypothetical protein A2X86_07160 [Bdellovibrionales bacterium GWA2_49_15]HAZ11945.1 hypothetical protein [Bdellovibrionales bacterium]
MDLPPFREESRTFYMKQIFLGLQRKGEISLWQNVLSNRVHQRAELNRVVLYNGMLKFLPMRGKNFNFNSRFPIYFYEKGKVIIFKSRILFHSSFAMEVELPSLIMAQEGRGEDRHDPSISNMIVKFKLLNSMDDTIYEKPLLNFSKNGACFRITSEERNRFINAKSMEFISLGEQNDQKRAEIKYVVNYLDEHYKVGRFFRVGIQLLPDAPRLHLVD